MRARRPSEVVYLRVPVDQMEELRHYAAHFDVSVPALVRTMIATTLGDARRRGRFELAAEAGK